MNPFEPIGDRPRWAVIHDILASSATGSVVTYEVMADALGLHAERDKHAIQMAMRRAARHYAQTHNRAVEAVPNKGYRIVEAAEHLRLARNQQRRATKAVARGHEVATHVDLNDLEPETRKAMLLVAQAFATQREFMRRMDVRQKRLEKAVEAMSEKHDRTSDEVSELRARLERLERGS